MSGVIPSHNALKFLCSKWKKTLWQGENITGGVIIAFHWAEPVPRLFGYFTMLDLLAWRTGAVDGTVSPGLCLLRHVKMCRAEKSSIVHSGLQSLFSIHLFFTCIKEKKNLSGKNFEVQISQEKCVWWGREVWEIGTESNGDRVGKYIRTELMLYEEEKRGKHQTCVLWTDEDLSILSPCAWQPLTIIPHINKTHYTSLHSSFLCSGFISPELRISTTNFEPIFAHPTSNVCAQQRTSNCIFLFWPSWNSAQVCVKFQWIFVYVLIQSRCRGWLGHLN